MPARRCGRWTPPARGHLRGSAVAKLLALDTPPAELEPGALEGIARFAVTAASLSTLRPGGISSIPTEAEVLAALEEIEARRSTGGPSIILQAVEKPSPKEGLGNDTSHGGRGDNFAGNRAPSAIQSFSAGCITLCGS